MSIPAALLLVQITTGSAGTAALPPCSPRQLVLATNDKDGAFDGMQKSGTELVIRNTGADCTLPAMPRITFLDAHRQPLPLSGVALNDVHAEAAMARVRVAGGNRATIDLSWIAGPVFPRNALLKASYLCIFIGGQQLISPHVADIDSEPAKTGEFVQSALRVDLAG